MNDEVQRYALYQEREDSEHCAQGTFRGFLHRLPTSNTLISS